MTNKQIEFSVDVTVAKTAVTDIEVKPLTFAEFSALYEDLPANDGIRKALQKARILHQTIFKAGDKVLTMLPEDLLMLPLPVARSIIAELDVGAGTPGEVVTEGDGVLSPIIFKLGTPIIMGDTTIEELEFMATVYGEVEDALACENEIARTRELLLSLAKPLGDNNLSRLPMRAFEAVTSSDGIAIMNHVTTAF